jgi:hypothetical protein
MPRKPMPWFRFYVEAVHDRKLRRLKPETRWLFVVCLAAARQSPEPGWLLVGVDDPMDLADLADFAYMPRKSVASGLDLLVEVGVVARDPDRSAWFVPNWDKRQYESDNSTTRTRKHRAKQDDDEGTTLERSNGVPWNGVTPSKERSRSVTETENRIQSSESEFQTPPMGSRLLGNLRVVGGVA